MQAIEILKSVYGFDSFRGAQEEIIECVTQGGDALVIMPTGSGKSLCYQIPALLRRGTAVVISPLIALMEDQVQALRQLGINAAYLNSSLSTDDAWAVRLDLENRKLDLLYIAPERLFSGGFLDLLSRCELALFAIDEAHCVSQWGHDFRPEYLQLAILKERFPDVPRIALTATADGPTRREIAQRLQLSLAREFVTGFDRPNICYRVYYKQQARKQLLEFIKSEHLGDSGIVYCMTRNKVEETATWLTEQGITAYPYHAGLSDVLRKKHQGIFIKEEGIVIVATIAFGMGIDKPNVRFVAHMDLPKSIEAYYQETGRAGRDGLPATAWMTYGLADLMLIKQMIEGSDSTPERKRVEQHKLNSLLGYVETTSCRRKVLLNYFGDTTTEVCNNCDTCLHPVSTWDGTIAAQQALSCVYRTGQRFGVFHLIDILRGVESEKVKRFRHHHLSTFGVGKALSNAEWTSVFRQIVALGYLKVDIDGYGGLSLTAECKAVLEGKVRVTLRKDLLQSKKTKASQLKESKPLSERISSSKTAIVKTQNNELFAKLRQKRMELAHKENVPPYVIFSDRTLHEMAEFQPRNLSSLQTIFGIGEYKLKKYGETFLKVLLHEEKV